MKFELTEDQEKKAQEWIKAQLRIKLNTGAIGGRFQYCFIPTGLGVIVILKDLATGDEADLTEFGVW